MKSLRAGIKITGFLIILIIGGLLKVNAQYKVEGRIVDVGSSFDDVSVVVETNGLKKDVILTNDGAFETYLQKNKIYRFSFFKPEFVAKVIEFSTKVPDNIHFESIQPYYLPVRLFKTFEGVDTVFFKQPVAKIRFDEVISDFADDRDYSLKVKYHIDEMRAEAEKQKEKPVLKKKKKPVEVSEVVELDKIKIQEDTTVIIHKEENFSIVGLPPLKESYPQGRTDEFFDMEGRTVERTIFMNGNVRKVYFVVKHHWGGVFYFIDQAEIGYRCISKKTYENLLANNELDNK
nr:hypothetical protein [uncultured Carboxylicivirga sp.]